MYAMPPSSTGRFDKREFTSNLGEMEDDGPEFVAFDDAEEGVGPRGPYDTVQVQAMDMCIDHNNRSHFTDSYRNNGCLVVRRGQPFQLRITFSQETHPDSFQLEFRISSIKLMVNFGGRAPGSTWHGQIVNMSGTVATVTVTPPPDAIVGKFRTYVGVVGGSGIHYSRLDNTDFYVLFNAWCPADSVFLPDGAARNEYVLNEYGLIFMGTAGAYSGRPWLYAQFDEGILDACIHILDRCRMPITHRGNAIKVTRQASEMINAQDNDNGVLQGNWGKTFPNGTSPLKWTGSKSILQQYIRSGVSVRYGQCWVFAAVFNTFLRCLGLPCRVVTNFNSAHDNDGNCKTDIMYKPSGEKDPSTRDSIWNFHCWNEVHMARPDLPAGLGGWQCVDATPQETSDGFFRCGPSSVAAVKDGQVCFPFDTPFVFAEVNSDVVHQTRDKYGGLTTFNVETSRVGAALLTKAVGSDTAQDITYTYKHPEGSPNDERAMNRAESLGCPRDHSDLSLSKLLIDIKTDRTVLKAHDVQLQLEFTNQSDEALEFHGSLKGAVVFYTGVEYSSFLAKPVDIHIASGAVEVLKVNVLGDHYMQYLGYQNTLQFTLTGQSGGNALNHATVVKMQSQSLNFKMAGASKLQQEMNVEVSFKNPYNQPLTNVEMGMEGNGLFNYTSNSFGSIEPHGTVTWNVPFKPWRTGMRYVFALLDSDQIQEVTGIISLYVEAD